MQRQETVKALLTGTQASIHRFNELYPHDQKPYVLALGVECTNVDPNILHQALLHLTRHHQILRATLGENDKKEAALLIHPITQAENFCHFTLVNISQPLLSVHQLYQMLKNAEQADLFDKPFSFKDGPLWRTALIQSKSNQQSQLLLVCHHLLMDKKSISIFFKDLTLAYKAMRAKTEPTLGLASLTDVNYRLEEKDREERLHFWKRELTDLTPTTLITDYVTEKNPPFAGQRIYFKLDSALLQGLNELAKKNSITLNTIFLSCLYSLLHLHTNETDICIGLTSANRRFKNIQLEESEHLINCLFNTLPLRTLFSSTTTFLELAKLIKKNLKQALENQIPLEEIQHALPPNTKAVLKTAMLFNILLAFHHQIETFSPEDAEASPPIDLNLERCKFPYFGLNFDCLKNGSCIAFVEYNTNLFLEKTMQRFIQQFQKILWHVLKEPECAIKSLPILLEEDKRLIQQLNDAAQADDDDLSVPDYFHKTSMAIPDQTAVVFHTAEQTTETMTYRELDVYSTQLANLLQQKFGSLQNLHIGMCTHRSPQLIGVLLAILKCGATLVALETEMNSQLVNKIEATQLAFIISDRRTHFLFDADFKLPIFNIDQEETKEALKTASLNYPDIAIQPNMAAYIISTSGTTSGERKLLKITHRGLTNLLYALRDQRFPAQTKILCTGLFTFDPAYYDLLVAIVTGGEIHLCSDDERMDPRKINELIRKGIDMAVLMPDMIAQLDPSLPLKVLVNMGDTPNETVLAAFIRNNPDLIIKNGYGPSENTICTTSTDYRPDTPNYIGTPLRNQQIYILNPTTLAICPPGIPGEIFIAGHGLAMEYINNADLTQKKFIFCRLDWETSRFYPVNSDLRDESDIFRLYATGDYACYSDALEKDLSTNQSLQIRYTGRKDGQVKIHGLRINLNSVKHVLENHPLIKEACVIVDPDSLKTNKTLIAYLVPIDESEETLSLLKEQLRSHLANSPLVKAAYPHHFVFLNKMPVNDSGKLNTFALPAPAKEAQPATPLQQNLTQRQQIILDAWKKHLPGDTSYLPLDCSFRYLGGDSLWFMKIKNTLQDAKLYCNPTIPLIDYMDMNICETADRLLSEYQFQFLSCWRVILECPVDRLDTSRSFFEQLPQAIREESNNEKIYAQKILGLLNEQNISIKAGIDPLLLLSTKLTDVDHILETKQVKKKSIKVPRIRFNPAGLTLFERAAPINVTNTPSSAPGFTPSLGASNKET